MIMPDQNQNHQTNFKGDLWMKRLIDIPESDVHARCGHPQEERYWVWLHVPGLEFRVRVEVRCRVRCKVWRHMAKISDRQVLVYSTWTAAGDFKHFPEETELKTFERTWSRAFTSSAWPNMCRRKPNEMFKTIMLTGLQQGMKTYNPQVMWVQSVCVLPTMRSFQENAGSGWRSHWH